MTGWSGLLIKLGVRFLVFTAVFWFAAKKHDKIAFTKKWAMPLVGLAFAVLNTALYWALESVLQIATLGALGFVMPLVANALILWATVAVFQKREWFQIEGVFAMIWMALALTVAHGVLWIGLDFIPSHV
jgi:uncharacterized membrane protein YvlD (DUF360 family)